MGSGLKVYITSDQLSGIIDVTLRFAEGLSKRSVPHLNSHAHENPRGSVIVRVKLVKGRPN